VDGVDVAGKRRILRQDQDDYEQHVHLTGSAATGTVEDGQQWQEQGL
jgi:hypothetical protein